MIWPQRSQGDRQQGETRQMPWQSKYNKRKDKATSARKEKKLGLATKKGKLRPKIKAMTMGVKNAIPKNFYCVYMKNKNKKICINLIGQYLRL